MNVAPGSKSLDAQINDYLLNASGHLRESKSYVDGRQVAAFGAAVSSGLVMMSQAEAAIVHNAGTAQPVTAAASTDNTWSVRSFDMNGDGINDFALFGYYSDGDSSAGINGTYPGGNNSVLGDGDVRKLSNSSNIGPSNTSWQTAANTYRDVFYSGTGASNWNGTSGETGLVGVRFKIGGSTHYGWIRLQVVGVGNGEVASLSATEWAYESCPDQPILAGATSGGATCAAPVPKSIPVMGPLAYGLTSLALGGLGLGSLRRRRRDARKAETSKS
jgi:hypothetical protein